MTEITDTKKTEAAADPAVGVDAIVRRELHQGRDMSDAHLIERYESVSSAPNISACGDGAACCDCKYIEQDSEVDGCEKHQGMYHDWDMPEEVNFVYRLVCDDFAPQDGDA